MKYLLFIFILCSCGPASQLRRADKLIKKAEALGAVVTRDTVYINKSLIIPVYKHDTVATYHTLLDTLIVNNEKVITKIKVDTVTKTWYVDQVVKGDTVFIKVPTKINTDIHAPKQINPWPWILAILIVILIIVLVKK